MIKQKEITKHLKGLVKTQGEIAKLRDLLREQIEEFEALFDDISEADEAIQSALRELEFAADRISQTV